jgi:hypothetical protein
LDIQIHLARLYALVIGADFHIHRQTATVYQTAKQQFIRQRTANRVLDQALHRACPHQWVKPFLAQVFTQSISKGYVHFLFCQLGFQLQQELVHHPKDDGFVQCLETDSCVQTVTELRGKQAFDIRHFVACLAWIGKTNRGLVHGFRARIGCHDDDDIAEIGLAPVVVGQCTVVHHLQKHIENVRMGLFNFIQQQNTMWLLGDGLGE